MDRKWTGNGPEMIFFESLKRSQKGHYRDMDRRVDRRILEPVRGESPSTKGHKAFGPEIYFFLKKLGSVSIRAEREQRVQRENVERIGLFFRFAVQSYCDSMFMRL